MSAEKKHKSSTMDMTRGNILKQIIIFAFPILLGDVFQQLYHSVDSIVVGRYVSHDAFGAVTSNMPAINTLIGLFIGFASGSSVVISQYFGSGDAKNLRKAVHTAVVATCIIGVPLSGIGVFAAPYIVKAMKADAAIAPYATTYLRIYFSGVLFLILYNMGMGILRAVGDSKRPLYFLIFSAGVNVVLDLLFVIKFNLGVAGVAYATVISEFLATLLTYMILFRSKEVFGLSFKELKFNAFMFRRIVNIGLPSGIQISLTSFSNLFVQGYINSFGNIATDGWGAYMRLNSFIMAVSNSLGMSTTTFTGQNYGAGRADRIKAGEKVALGMNFTVLSCMGILIWSFAAPLVSIFNENKEVISCGVYFVKSVIPFCGCSAVFSILAAILRGTGDSKGPTVIMLSSFVLFRQLYLLITTRFTGDITPVTYAYPAGWIVCVIFMSLYYFRKRKSFGSSGLPEEGDEA